MGGREWVEVMLKFCFRTALFLFLSILTQIGGLAYLLALSAGRIFRHNQSARRSATAFLFLGSYAVLSVASLFIAPVFGRTPLPCLASDDAELAMQSPLYCVLNRQYVTPEVKQVALDLSSHVATAYPGSLTLALDGNFPFLDGFPLLPHLSHDDGRKLDLAFYYRASGGDYLRGATRSPIGYWAFEAPADRTDLPCEDRTRLLSMRWDVKWFRPMLSDHVLDRERTRAALQWLITSGRDAGVSKIFIEPHLARSLNVESDIIRFQGCRAARHDDHIHLQIRQ